MGPGLNAHVSSDNSSFIKGIAMQPAADINEVLVPSESKRQRKSSALFSVIMGAMLSVMGAFPVGILIACVYGYSVPMVGWVSGPELIATRGIADFVYGFPKFTIGIMLSVFIDGILGGYVFLVTVGGIGGWLAHPKGEFNYRQVIRANLTIAIVVNLIYTIVVVTINPAVLFWYGR